MSELQNILTGGALLKSKNLRDVSRYRMDCLFYDIMRNIGQPFGRHEAQLLERWTPGGERSGSRRPGVQYIKLLTGMARLVGPATAK